jgi:hypothetical protein
VQASCSQSVGASASSDVLSSSGAAGTTGLGHGAAGLSGDDSRRGGRTVSASWTEAVPPRHRGRGAVPTRPCGNRLVDARAGGCRDGVGRRGGGRPVRRLRVDWRVLPAGDASPRDARPLQPDPASARTGRPAHDRRRDESRCPGIDRACRPRGCRAGPRRRGRQALGILDGVRHGRQDRSLLVTGAGAPER